jgi:hypothetical protein
MARRVDNDASGRMTLVEFEVPGEKLHSGFSLAMDVERVPVP